MTVIWRMTLRSHHHLRRKRGPYLKTRNSVTRRLELTQTLLAVTVVSYANPVLVEFVKREVVQL